MNHRLKKTERLAALSFLMACLYFAVAVAHIYHLPCLTTQHTHTVAGSNSLFKRKTENLSTAKGYANMLQRTYKSVTNDKRSATDFLKKVCACIVLLLFAVPVWKLRPQWNALLSFRDDSPQPVYLAIRSLRI